jgi:hypothetical protein
MREKKSQTKEISIFSNSSHLEWYKSPCQSQNFTENPRIFVNLLIGGAVGHNIERGPPKDHSSQICFNLA